MASINDYASKNGEYITGANYTEQDALLFAELSYIPFEWNENWPESITLDHFLMVARKLVDDQPNKGPWVDKITMLENMVASGRYEKVRISNLQSVDPSKADSIQWAGITVDFKDKENTSMISFRGTDSSAVGWREDFELAYMMDGTGAQKLSAEYLKEFVENHPNSNVIVTGHSKGGNDAIYSYLANDSTIRDHVSKVYNFDGPGIMSDLAVTYQDAYDELDDKLSTYCPKNSIIGLLMMDHGKITYVDSTGKSPQSSIPILSEHDAYTWILNEDGTFVEVEQSFLSSFVNTTLDQTLTSMDEKERENLVVILGEMGVFDMIAGEADDKGVIEKIAEACGNYNALSHEQKEVAIKVTSTIAYSAIFPLYQKAEHFFDGGIDYINRGTDEIKNNIQNKFDKVRAGLEKLGVDPSIVDGFEKFSKGVVDGIGTVAKGFVNFVRKQVIGGSYKVYSKEVIDVKYVEIERASAKLKLAQNIIEDLDYKLDRLSDCLAAYELIDKANVKSLDFRMTGSSIKQNIGEMLLNKGYDWEVTKCSNYLNSVSSKLQQNENSLKIKSSQI